MSTVEILNKSNGTSGVRYRRVIYWLCIIFFHQGAANQFLDSTRQCTPCLSLMHVFVFFKKQLNKISNLHFTLHGQCASLCFLHIVYLAVNSQQPVFLISNHHFVVLFTMISSYFEPCCTRFLPQLKFEESYLRAIDNLSTDN